MKRILVLIVAMLSLFAKANATETAVTPASNDDGRAAEIARLDSLKPIKIERTDVSLSDLLVELSNNAKISYAANSEDLKPKITLDITVSPWQAMQAIAKAGQCTLEYKSGVWMFRKTSSILTAKVYTLRSADAGLLESEVRKIANQSGFHAQFSRDLNAFTVIASPNGHEIMAEFIKVVDVEPKSFEITIQGSYLPIAVANTSSGKADSTSTMKPEADDVFWRSRFLALSDRSSTTIIEGEKSKISFKLKPHQMKGGTNVMEYEIAFNGENSLMGVLVVESGGVDINDLVFNGKKAKIHLTANLVKSGV